MENMNINGNKSPLRSPALSPARSPGLSPNRSPNKSPNISPRIGSPNFGSPPHQRHRSASIPVTPESLKTVRSRFINSPEGLCPLGEGAKDNFLVVEADTRSKLPRSAPELTVDEASPGSISPWNDDPGAYMNSLACTVQKQQPELLSRRFSETLTVSKHHRSRRRKSLSPCHGRSMSFRSPRPRGNSIPYCSATNQQRDRSPSVPPDWDDDWYTLRQFCLTTKGGVINKGDLYRHRSRSNTSVASTGSGMTYGASSTTSCSSGHPAQTLTRKVLMMGTIGVGKTSLVTQFMSSEYMHSYDGSLGLISNRMNLRTTLREEETEKNVSLLLDGEEYELSFIDPPTMAETPTEDQLEGCDAFVVVYSITDRPSFCRAVDALFKLRDKGCTANKAVILVGNKADLVRSREIQEDEAKSVACSYECKFIETSAAISHQVDELLVGIVTQIRLKMEQQVERKAFQGEGLQKRRSSSRIERRASSILSRLLGKGKLKSQSCGNLYVL